MVTSQLQRIGRYDVIREISHSGIAVVYLAKDPRLDREVAIKLVLPGRELSNEFQTNFRIASKDLAQLSHANIIKVLDFGEQDGSPFIVMEYLKNGSLADRIGQPTHWQEAVRLVAPIAHALDYAHSENLVHRDIKPANILFTDEGQPVITDLNFVALIEDEETRDFTSTTVGMGKPEYMSPEQGKGGTIDHRADIYSLGIIFYELVTGQKPFASENPMEVVIQQVTTPPPDPRKFVSNLPSGLVQIMMKALSKDPDQRYASMDLFAKDLEKFLNKKGGMTDQQANKNTKRYAVLGVVLALAIAGTWFGWRQFNAPADISPENTAITSAENSVSTSSPETASTQNPDTTEISPTVESSTPTVIPIITDLFPLIPGQTLPYPADSITPQNVHQIMELARWGRPKFTEIVWTPDNSQLVAATSNGIYFFDSSELTLQRILDLKAWMTTIDVSADGKYIAAGDNHGLIQVLDFSSGEILFTLQGHVGEITSLSFSPDSSRLLSSSKDTTAAIWNMDDGTLIYTLKEHLLPINSVHFSSDGTTVITGSEDFRVILWDAATGTKINTYTAKAQVQQLALSPDQKTLATALRNSTVQFWNMDTNSTGITLQDRALVQAVNTVSFSPNGQLVLSGAADSSIRMWQAATGDELWETSGAKDPEHIDKTLDAILSISFSPDGNRFVSVTEGGYLAVWNVGTQSIVKSNKYLWQQTTRLTFSPQTNYLVIQDGVDHVEVWNVSNGSLDVLIEGTLARGDPFSEEENMIAILSSNGNIIIYDLKTHDEIVTLQGYSPDSAVNFLNGSKFIAAATNKKVTLWSINSGQELEFSDSSIDGNCQVINGIDGTLLVAGSKIGLLQSPDAVNGFCAIRRSTTVLNEDFLPSGSMVAFATNNKNAILWSQLVTGGTESTFTGHIGKVYGVGLSPDGKLMATTGEDHKVLIWSTTNTEEPLLILENHYGPVLAVDFSADGKYLATSSVDGAVQIWGIIQ